MIEIAFLFVSQLICSDISATWQFEHLTCLNIIWINAAEM